jgi:hypothetical protein
MTRQEKMLSNLMAALTPELQKEITLLKRKLVKMEQQRDNWKETALRYQKNLIERSKK